MGVSGFVNLHGAHAQQRPDAPVHRVGRLALDRQLGLHLGRCAARILLLRLRQQQRVAAAQLAALVALREQHVLAVAVGLRVGGTVSSQAATVRGGQMARWSCSSSLWACDFCRGLPAQWRQCQQSCYHLLSCQARTF